MIKVLVRLPRSRAFLFAFVVLLTSLMCPGVLPQSVTCGESTIDGKGLAERYDEAVKASPDNAAMYVARGWSLFRLGRFSEAVADANKAIELDPRSDKALMLSAGLYSHRASYAWAIVQYTKAIALNPKNAVAYYSRGRLRRIRRESLAAVNDFSRAIELNPDNTDAYFLRGAEYRNRGEKEKATADFETGLQIQVRLMETISGNQCLSMAHITRSFLYRALGNSRQALDDLNQAVELRPKFYEPYHFRGEFHLFARDYENAIDELSRAIELDPGHAESYELRASAYDGLRQKESAAADRKMFETLSRGVRDPK